MGGKSLKACSLSSGSNGNSYFIGTRNTKILIDAGLRGKDIDERLQNIGENIREIEGIFISHEHNDHALGAGVLARKYKIPIYATEGTWSNMKVGNIPEGCLNAIKQNSETLFGDLSVRSFPIPHDSKEPVAFTLEYKGKKIAIATDIGHMNSYTLNHISGSHLLYLESNHDTEMLMKGPYPWFLKKRVSGPVGHLSNIDAAETLVTMNRAKECIVSLSHLSETNNDPQMAIQTVLEVLKSKGILDIQIDVSLRRTIGKIYNLEIS